MAAGYHDGSTTPPVLPFYGQEAIGSVTIYIEDPAEGAAHTHFATPSTGTVLQSLNN
ncbi:MAG TPA: hypothetical protein VMP68_14555 [Candidatus Eisenbacteria bacterium]|nr:hypothetical protein [Candidatus Eisenbacteria bacterium]